MRTGLCAHWVGGASTKSHHGHRRSHRANTKQHRAGNVSEASGQCEVLAKCERTIELPQNAETGAPRADANDGEKAGVKLAKMLNYTYSLFGGVKRRQQNQKFPSFQIFRFAAGGVGGAANKNDRKFLGFAPRELVESGRGASVIRQNPADFARNTFELCPTNTANRNFAYI